MKKILLFLFIAFSSVLFSQTAGLVVTATTSNPSCFGSCNGTAFAIASGGVGPYGYIFSSAAISNIISQQVSSLCAGTYTVTAIDSSTMSTANYVFTLTQPNQIFGQTNGTNQQICIGGCAQLYVSVTGGTPPYTYNWSPQVGISQPGGIVTTACPTSTTTYVCAITDAHGCSPSNTNAFVVAVIVNPAPSITTTSNPSTCGQCNGSAAATTTGSTSATTYSWAGPNGYTSTTATPGNMCAGTYTVTAASNVSGCTGGAIVVVGSSPSITAASISTTAASCNTSNGSITITSVIGGTAPYLYYLNGTTYTSGTINNLPAGTYQIGIIDANQCNFITTATIQSTSGLSVVVDLVTPSGCNGLATGGATVHGTGGASPYSYLWSPSGQTTASLTSVAAGAHTVLVTDNNGCSITYQVAIPTSSAPTVVLDSLVNINCQSASAGTILVHGAGGVAPYSYLWNNGATTQMITGLPVGPYYVSVTDANGCSGIHTYQIQNNGNLFIATQTTFANCANNGTANVVATGGTPPYTYSWSNGQVIGSGTNATGLNGATIYTVTVTDASGCSANGTVYVQNLCYNVIRGTVYNDLNGNCIRDAGEPAVNTSVYAQNGTLYTGYGSTYNNNGNYTIYTQSMNNNVSLGYLPLYTNQTCPVPPSTQIANFTTMGDTINGVDFAVQTLSNINDLKVVFYPGNARPGFLQSGYLYYYNVGTTAMSGVTVSLTHDSILTFNSSTPASANYTYPTNTWNIGTLNPGQYGYITVYYSVPLIANGGYIGRVLHYSATINPLGGDNTPLDNVSVTTRTITNSYDPNEKEVEPAGNISVADTLLHYTIHFQNTGNDTAFTVVVKDVLSQYLDISSLQPGISSHPYEFTLAFNGEMTFRFNHILLVDSATNEPLSHGFVNYTVRPLASNPIGTVINNTAYIYFDFNEAIVTNTTSNLLVGPTSISQLENTGNVKVFPNPFNDNTTFFINTFKGEFNFELIDVLGKKVKEINNISSKQFNLNRGGLENGIYFFRIYNIDGLIGNGKLIIK
jgi:uncharacterized repeat protein (TIGR01451 family)